MEINETCISNEEKEEKERRTLLGPQVPYVWCATALHTDQAIDMSRGLQIEEKQLCHIRFLSARKRENEEEEKEGEEGEEEEEEEGEGKEEEGEEKEGEEEGEEWKEKKKKEKKEQKKKEKKKDKKKRRARYIT
jgi:outer membrane biosynthesis protein TonB